MGVEDGGGKKGEIVDLNKIRTGRNLPEATEEMAKRSINEFAQKTVQRLAEKKLMPVSVRGYEDPDLEVILFQALQGRGQSGDEFLYAAAQEYLERKKAREQMQNPNH